VTTLWIAIVAAGLVGAIALAGAQIKINLDRVRGAEIRGVAAAHVKKSIAIPRLPNLIAAQGVFVMSGAPYRDHPGELINVLHHARFHPESGKLNALLWTHHKWTMRDILFGNTFYIQRSFRLVETGWQICITPFKVTIDSYLCGWRITGVFPLRIHRPLFEPWDWQEFYLFQDNISALIGDGDTILRFHYSGLPKINTNLKYADNKESAGQNGCSPMGSFEIPKGFGRWPLSAAICWFIGWMILWYVAARFGHEKQSPLLIVAAFLSMMTAISGLYFIPFIPPLGKRTIF
jgi:hypothetical protein